MAGLKKTKKEKNPNPNLVLIIFLVFFFLVSIGLGIWGYYGYAGQDELRRAKFSADASAKGANLGKRFYALQYRYLRTAIGDKDKLDEKEVGQLNDDLDEFYKDNGGLFKDEADKEAARTLLEKLKKELGTIENNNRDLRTDYPKELKSAQDKAKEWEGKVAAANAKAERMEDFVKKIRDKQDTFFQETSDRIAKDNAALLVIAKEKTDTFKKTSDNNQDLIQQLKDKDAEIFNKGEEHEKALKALVRKINALEKDLKEVAAAGGGGGGAMNTGRAGEASPLLLDISMGKPLWDQPVGKIMRVDLELRQVAINLGSAHGVRPELTFNIFGANASGRAEKQMKGSIEIIKVVDANTSLARITSLYDAEGQPILMNLKTRGRVLRETEAPIREGDLLFNLFWGTRVAVAGYVSITGEPSDNPAEQNRQMEDFMHLLRRNGMQVDAYVDLRDGQIRGNINAKTRYLIRGDDLRAAADAKTPAPKAADDEKDKEKEKRPAAVDLDARPKAADDEKDKEKEKEAAKEPAPNTDRNDLINKSSRTLYNDARDRGLLLISSENFATLIGYRRARSANNPEISSFRPSLPYAGTGQTGVLVIPDARPKDEEKKGPDMEKKAGD